MNFDTVLIVIAWIVGVVVAGLVVLWVVRLFRFG
jgi:hypothetical protein